MLACCCFIRADFFYLGPIDYSCFILTCMGNLYLIIARMCLIFKNGEFTTFCHASVYALDLIFAHMIKLRCLGTYELFSLCSSTFLRVVL